jgi:hypothetical protein
MVTCLASGGVAARAVFDMLGSKAVPLHSARRLPTDESKNLNFRFRSDFYIFAVLRSSFEE